MSRVLQILLCTMWPWSQKGWDPGTYSLLVHSGGSFLIRQAWCLISKHNLFFSHSSLHLHGVLKNKLWLFFCSVCASEKSICYSSLSGFSSWASHRPDNYHELSSLPDNQLSELLSSSLSSETLSVLPSRAAQWRWIADCETSKDWRFITWEFALCDALHGPTIQPWLG